MPIDPYFTSAVKDERAERAAARQVYAKAIRFRLDSYKWPQKNKLIALGATGDSTAVRCARILRHNVYASTGKSGPALTGFKPAKIKWDKQ